MAPACTAVAVTQICHALCADWPYCMQGWNLALKDDASSLVTEEQIETRLEQRGIKDLTFLDALSWRRVSSVSKPVRNAIAKEKHVLTVNSPRFIHGTGIQK